ncbi:MAG: hypothetical protein ABIK89_07855 [Planctomycetota bacterium]
MMLPFLRTTLAFGACLAVVVIATASDQGSMANNAGLIVFSSNRSGPWRIWTVRPDGTEMKRLADGDPDEHDVDPRFIPDGDAILFSSTRGGAVGVWKMAADGSRPERICDGDQADWSPDGKSVVFRRSERLFTRELASGEEKCISPEDWPHCSGPAYGPDGKTIAFACRWDGGNAIYVVAADGGEPTKVYDRKGACEPHWSPDGKRLVYETETNVAAVNPDGTKNRPVTWFGGIQRYPEWSPDGKSIVFCQGPSERGPWELYRIASQGGTPEKITEGGSDMNPDWK